MGINMPIDGNKLSVYLGGSDPAVAFRAAVKNNDQKKTVQSFKNMADQAMRKCAMVRSKKSTDFIKGLSKTSIVKMMSDPDWKPVELAKLLIATAKIPAFSRSSWPGERAAGNLLYALNYLDSTKVDNILTEIGKIDSKAKTKIKGAMADQVAREEMWDAIKNGTYTGP